MDLPVYAISPVARTARGRIVERDWNVPVTIAGVTVEPGDLVIADGSGVAFIPAARAAEVLAMAETVVRKERVMAEAVRKHTPISQVMGANYEDMLKKGDDQ